MSSINDIKFTKIISIFAKLNLPVAFLTPTHTGYKKSIMDAISPVRDLLLNSNIHDYSIQKQGPENKVLVDAFFVTPKNLIDTYASLYRPKTKKGDPRIWFHHLKKYCKPYDFLALVPIDRKIYVFNLSDSKLYDSLLYCKFAYSILEKASCAQSLISAELLEKLRLIHKSGFLPSLTDGDSGVGDTLENALGISRNKNKTPDYKGIELKATRLTRNGMKRAKTRMTLFTKVPDEGLSYKEIVKFYGKYQTPRNSTTERLQLYDTFICSKFNSYNLGLDLDINADRLNMLYSKNKELKLVCSWYINNLKEILLQKHPETFWIKAESITRNGKEYFRYDKVLHTQNPNISLLVPLLKTGKITLDLAGHYKKNGKFRDHGILFKMYPDDLPLLLGTPKEYIL